MARLSMNEITTFRWSFEEDVRNYASAGFDAITVWRQKLSDFGEEKAAELVAESGLAVAGVLWAGGFTGSDGRTYKESLDDARDAVQLAANLKADALMVYSGSRAGHTHNHAKRLFRTAMAELAPLAAERGIVLAVEPMHAGCAGEWTFLTDFDQALETIHAIGSPNVKLVFDAYHFGYDSRVLNRLAELTPMIALVQLGDAKAPPMGEQNRCRIGEGIIPLRHIIAAVRGAGYSGYFDIELMGEDLNDPDYEELIRQSKGACQQLLADERRVSWR
jgi:sugar phosphate isomerase/epimerase